MRAVAIAAGVALAACAESYTPAPDVGDAFKDFGAEPCNIAGEKGRAYCSEFRSGPKLTSILDMPLRARDLGWRVVPKEPGFPPVGLEQITSTTWLERPISGDCSQLLSMQVAMKVPDPGEVVGSVTVVLSSDYPPVCGAERQMQ